MIVNKQELSKILRCSLPTLDRLIERYRIGFPVVTPGSAGREWQFEVEDVLAFLKARKAADEAAGEGRDDLVGQYTLPATDDPDLAGMSPANLFKLAQLRKLEREQQKEAAFLVQVDKVRPLLIGALAKFHRDMVAGIRRIMLDQNIPEAAISGVEASIADAQRRLEKDLGSLLIQQDENSNQVTSLL